MNNVYGGNILNYKDEMLNCVTKDVTLRRIRFCIIFLASGFILGVAFCFFYKVFLGLDYPFSTFLFRPHDRFQDFLGVLRMTADRNPYQVKIVEGIWGHYPVEASNYFPFTHLLLYPFTLINKYLSLLIYSLSVICFWVFASAKALDAGLFESKKQRFLNIMVLTLMNYPLLFILDRGNVEGIVFLFLAYAVWFYAMGSGKWSAVFIGLAAAIKGTPILFLLFFIKERRWKELMIGIAVPFCLSLVALLFLQGGVLKNLILFKDALQNFGEFLLIGHNGITHSVSLFGMVYSLWLLANKFFLDVASLKPIVASYNVAAGIMGLAAIAYVCFSRLEPWKAWFVLVAAMQVLPFPSYDYKLINTFLPLFLLIRSGRETQWTKAYLTLLCLIIVPKGFWILFLDVRCGTILNPLLILMVCIMIIVEQYKEARLYSTSFPVS
ncbi:MAG: glycosyltransferase family 87 protein [Smithella sp.]